MPWMYWWHPKFENYQNRNKTKPANNSEIFNLITPSFTFTNTHFLIYLSALVSYQWIAIFLFPFCLFVSSTFNRFPFFVAINYLHLECHCSFVLFLFADS